ncbi:MAG: V-type ATP synthase subunit E [Oscillospiraceae bacterium]
MNGIEKISARILADAETEAAAIRAQAEEKAAQLRADYDQNRSEQQRLTAEAQAEADKQLERDQGAARMAARRQLLETKQALVDAAFRQAEQQLLSLPTAEYTKLCAQLAARASASGSEELIFCTEDRERVGQAVVEQANALLQKAGKAAKLTLSAETRPMRGGVVLKDGLVETNCSIGTMISGLRPALSGKVAACLFG